jgi:hypothetical protein
MKKFKIVGDMENNQNEKVSITFEVEKDFIKAVMLVSGFDMVSFEDVKDEINNVVINEEVLRDFGTDSAEIQQIKSAISMIAIGMAFRNISSRKCGSKKSGLFAKLQALEEEKNRKS